MGVGGGLLFGGSLSALFWCSRDEEGASLGPPFYRFRDGGSVRGAIARKTHLSSCICGVPHVAGVCRVYAGAH